jgi:hypothetical protein
VTDARNEMVGLENLSDDDLDRLQHEFDRVREHADERLKAIQEHRKSRSVAGRAHEKKSGNGAGADRNK